MMIYQNGDYVEETEAKVSSFSQSFQYGLTFFETMKWENHEVPLLDEHLDRLEEGISRIGKKVFRIDEIATIIEHLYEKNSFTEKEMTVKIIYGPNPEYVLLYMKPYRYTESMRQRGFKVGFAKDRRDSTNRWIYYKTGNYLCNYINLMEGKKIGLDEVIFCNERETIAEGSFTNIFFRKDNMYYTPPIEDGILPGIQRRKWMETLKNQGKNIRIQSIPKMFYRECDAVFLTNALMGIMKVCSFEDKIYL